MVCHPHRLLELDQTLAAQGVQRRMVASVTGFAGLPALPMYLVWHLRHQADPLHQWLRQLIEDGVAPALAAAGGGDARRPVGLQ